MRSLQHTRMHHCIGIYTSYFIGMVSKHCYARMPMGVICHLLNVRNSYQIRHNHDDLSMTYFGQSDPINITQIRYTLCRTYFASLSILL